MQCIRLERQYRLILTKKQFQEKVFLLNDRTLFYFPPNQKLLTPKMEQYFFIPSTMIYDNPFNNQSFIPSIRDLNQHFSPTYFTHLISHQILILLTSLFNVISI